MTLTSVKFVGAWVCIVLSIAFLVLGGNFAALPMLFAVLSLAFSMAPPAL
jgi:hypothetical protein